MSLFVTCGPCLEPLLAEELQQLGLPVSSQGFRGVYVADSSMTAIYTINYCSRLASRVLLPLRQFRCRDKKALYANASEIEWHRYLPKDASLAIDANVHHHELRHSLFAAQVVKDAICDVMRRTTGQRPNINLQEPDLQLNLFIDKEHAIISFDTSGQPLHKRGYRQEAGTAPLQETLAAALLRLAHYNASDTLVDPCCGSGTLLIEAALIATHTSPGYLRKKWGFDCHPEFDNADWLTVKNRADSLREPLREGAFFGCEIDSNVARFCRANLRAAGFHKEIEITRGDFNSYVPKGNCNFVISNPPHGRRLESEGNLATLYRALGDFMKRKLAKPGRGFIFTSSLELAKEVGLAAQRRHVLSFGGVDARLLAFDIY